LHKLTSTYLAGIVQENGELKLEDILELQVALVNFASKCYPGQLEYIDQVHQFSVSEIRKKNAYVSQRAFMYRRIHTEAMRYSTA
jgi:hypothetical protein